MSRALVCMFIACRCGGAPPAPEAAEHFMAAEEVVLAALTGDEAEVKAWARQAEAPEGGDREAAEALHAALGFLQVAEGPEELMEGILEMAQACGACHAAEGRAFGPDALPPEGGFPAPVGPCLRAWWAVALNVEAEVPEPASGAFAACGDPASPK